MDGVTILQTFTNTSTTWGWSWFGAFLAVFVVANIVMACFSDDWSAVNILSAAVCCLGAILSFGTATEVPAPDTYQVLVEDTVSLNEFTKEYNILEIQGETYLVEKREEITERNEIPS